MKIRNSAFFQNGSPTADHTGFKQHRFGQCGLSRSGVAGENDITDRGWVVCSHNWSGLEGGRGVFAIVKMIWSYHAAAEVLVETGAEIVPGVAIREIGSMGERLLLRLLLSVL